MSRWFQVPEVTVAAFSFMLHLLWEFAQVPLFADMPSLGHWRVIQVCGSATVGDAVIALLAFWGVALMARSRRWLLRPSRRQILVFVAIGLAITVGIEWLSTQVLDRWAYGPDMPVLPGLRVGLSPVLQWLVVPPLVVWFSRRLMAGIVTLREEM
ncbi:MAG: hypothetical protein ACREDW_09145 [Aestuariivirgaceae bacterium]